MSKEIWNTTLMGVMYYASDMNGEKMSESCCKFPQAKGEAQARRSPQLLIRKTLPSTATENASIHPVGYDIVILSDLLHFSTSHDALLLSLTSLLAKNRTSRAYVAAGNYTPPSICENFLREGERLGIIWKEGGDDEYSTTMDNEWRGTLEVSGLDKEQLAIRKGACRWWLGRWVHSDDPEVGLS